MQKRNPPTAPSSSEYVMFESPSTLAQLGQLLERNATQMWRLQGINGELYNAFRDVAWWKEIVNTINRAMEQHEFERGFEMKGASMTLSAGILAERLELYLRQYTIHGGANGTGSASLRRLIQVRLIQEILSELYAHAQEPAEFGTGSGIAGMQGSMPPVNATLDIASSANRGISSASFSTGAADFLQQAMGAPDAGTDNNMAEFDTDGSVQLFFSGLQ